VSLRVTGFRSQPARLWSTSVALGRSTVFEKSRCGGRSEAMAARGYTQRSALRSRCRCLDLSVQRQRGATIARNRTRNVENHPHQLAGFGYPFVIFLSGCSAHCRVVAMTGRMPAGILVCLRIDTAKLCGAKSAGRTRGKCGARRLRCGTQFPIASRASRTPVFCGKFAGSLREVFQSRFLDGASIHLTEGNPSAVRNPFAGFLSAPRNVPTVTPRPPVNSAITFASASFDVIPCRLSN
jgi:hypothetical protein